QGTDTARLADGFLTETSDNQRLAVQRFARRRINDKNQSFFTSVALSEMRIDRCDMIGFQSDIAPECQRVNHSRFRRGSG
ncbi:hypothetical protein KUCAC02_035574, partial [Chaenocephalus aceratus]